MDTVTSTSLLLALRNRSDDQAWSNFCSRYRPVLLAFGQRLGLKPDEAEDAAQEALMSFAESYLQGRYDKDRGRLRTWLMGIAAHKARDVQRGRGKEQVVNNETSQTAFMDRVLDDATISEVWEAEWRAAVLKACMDEVRRQVKPTAMRSFELFVLDDWPADKVAAELGISRDLVYTNKLRILERLQEVRARLEEDW
jgi:RNA polymerase sigma factor (sigma-70 family)